MYAVFCYNLSQYPALVTQCSACSPTCEDMKQKIEADAKEKNMLHCEGLRMLFGYELNCLEDNEGNSCGGKEVATQAMTTTFNAFNEMLNGGPKTNEQLQDICENSCAQKASNIFRKMYAGATGELAAINEILGMTRELVCKRLDNKYCFNGAQAALKAMMGIHNTSTAVLDEHVCGDSLCGSWSFNVL